MVFWGVGILFVQKCSLKACNFCVRVIIKLPLALGMPTNALALARGASQAKRARPHFLAPLFSATQQSVAYSCPLCILHMYTRVYLATRRAKAARAAKPALKYTKNARPKPIECREIRVHKMHPSKKFNFEIINMWIFAPKLEDIFGYYIQKYIKSFNFHAKILDFIPKFFHC